jgi:putative hydrolase of the HAD superfamily
MLDIIAFDADDTLWHTESLYAEVEEKFVHLLAPYADYEKAMAVLNAAEIRNIPYFGYGIKSFTLSMIEAAIELSAGQILGSQLKEVLALSKMMVAAPVQLLDHAEATVAQLAQTHTLMLITKGDLLDQESKIERSGLARYFKYIEVVSDKTTASYAAVLSKYQVSPERFLMVGNSLRSDILPVVALGGAAVYIPYHITWTHEVVAPTPAEQGSYYELDHLGLLPAWVEAWTAKRRQGQAEPQSEAAKAI